MSACPCCGQSVVALPVAGLQELLTASPTGQAIVGVLSAVYPRALSRAVIADRVYARLGSGGPMSAENVISVTLNRIRPTLRPHGWDIASTQGRTGGIRLQRIEQ